LLPLRFPLRTPCVPMRAGRAYLWFIRCLNESIAREGQCKGCFWEDRFKALALLDEWALAACTAYVDLKLIRAKMAETPEASDLASIRQRI